MKGVPAGEHTLTFSHIPLDSAGVQAPQFPIRVGAETKVRLKAAIPSAPSVDRYAVMPTGGSRPWECLRDRGT